MWWETLISALGKFLAAIAEKLGVFLVALNLGREKAEKEALAEQAARIQRAKKAEIDAEDPSYTDPYLRD